MSEVATRASWKTLPCPDGRAPLPIDRTFSPAEAERLRHGLIPQDMDDRWFVYQEGDRLYVHRSWTGSCIFGLRLDEGPDGARIADAWASRDQEQYRSTDVGEDVRMLRAVIDMQLAQGDVARP